MGKSSHFHGQSVFGQLISKIDFSKVNKVAIDLKADYYTKRFTTKDHLISMLFGSFAQCSSLREISGAMLGLSGKTHHFQLENLPYRSTLSDANKRRSSDVFCAIYNALLQQYGHLLSDSRIKNVINKQIEIFDSTTISLFSDIMKCVGRKPKSGKQKGGVKVHTVMNVDEKVPKMVWFTEASAHDHALLDRLEPKSDTIYVFDKGYNDYKVFEKLTLHKTGFVTRIKDNAVYAELKVQDIDDNIHSGVQQDTIIELTVKHPGAADTKLILRKITFYDRVLKRKFEFLTNLFDMRPDLVAAIYKLRWQIELLFKQLKQNFPLKYFLGDNENAIKIQIYCALIVNLLATVVQKTLKRKWAFSNLVSFCKIHLFNYINIYSFFENPEKDWQKAEIDTGQLRLF
jgi:hypothetical protein